MGAVSAQNDLRAKASGTGGGSFNEERQRLRAEMSTLRESQAGHKSSRTRTMDQVKHLQDNIANKVGLTSLSAD